jgi:putative ABC transport system permease protein
MEVGKAPDNTSSAYQITLNYDYAPYLGYASDSAAVGQTITLGLTDANGTQSTVTATIVGVQLKSIIGSGTNETNNALYNKLYDIQSQGLPASLKGKYSTAVAHFDTSLSTQGVNDMKQTLSNDGYTAQTVADEIGIVEQVINSIVVVFDAFGAIALLAASFGVINTLLMAVQERTKEIGLMKAMGMSGRRIFLLFSFEAILLGFWGSFLGVLAAMGIGQIANHVASKGFAKDFVGLHLLAFPWQSVTLIMLIIMVITFLAGTLPARRAARLNPIDALRYE